MLLLFSMQKTLDCPHWKNFLRYIKSFLSYLRLWKIKFSDVNLRPSASFKDTLLNDIRKAREKYQGEELAKELTRIKLRIDNTEVLTQDIVMNLLFSYRDIQVLHALPYIHL